MLVALQIGIGSVHKQTYTKFASQSLVFCVLKIQVEISLPHWSMCVMIVQALNLVLWNNPLQKMQVHMTLKPSVCIAGVNVYNLKSHNTLAFRDDSGSGCCSNNR